MGLDSVEIVMEAERLFNIELSNEDVEKVTTFGSFVECVHFATNKRGYQLGKSEIEDVLRKMVSEHLVVKPEDIHLSSRFVEDLGMQ